MLALLRKAFLKRQKSSPVGCFLLYFQLFIIHFFYCAGLCPPLQNTVKQQSITVNPHLFAYCRTDTFTHIKNRPLSESIFIYHVAAFTPLIKWKIMWMKLRITLSIGVSWYFITSLQIFPIGRAQMLPVAGITSV